MTLLNNKALREAIDTIMNTLGETSDISSAATDMLALVKEQQRALVKDTKLKQLNLLIKNTSTITLRGYGGEKKSELDVITKHQLQMDRLILIGTISNTITEDK